MDSFPDSSSLPLYLPTCYINNSELSWIKARDKVHLDWKLGLDTGVNGQDGDAAKADSLHDDSIATRKCSGQRPSFHILADDIQGIPKNTCDYADICTWVLRTGHLDFSTLSGNLDNVLCISPVPRCSRSGAERWERSGERLPNCPARLMDDLSM